MEVRHAERGDKRRILELAERNARFALDQDRLRSERRRSQRIQALDGLQQALGMETIPMRIECFDISNLMGDHTVASMVAFEGGAPKKSDYRRFGIRGSVQDDFAAMAEVLSRRMAQFVAQRERSPHDPDFDESFASVPALDRHRRWQGAALRGPGRARPVPRPRGDRGEPRQAGRGGVPARPPAPLVLPHDTPELQLLQRVRDEAHRFAIEFHRGRRDKAMTRSILDGLPGVGPVRKRSILPPLRLAGAVPGGQPRGAGGGAGPAGQGRAGSSRVRAQGAMTTNNDKGRLEDFVVITGFSGAGKSQAMATFEDAGYFCVDNLPPEMIGSLADLFGHEGSKVERAAVASDVRGGEYFDGLVRVVDDLEARGVPTALLFLEAGDEILINRFKETRRRHPLANGGSVERAIRGERALLAPLKERADVSIDTSDLSASRLRKVVADKMLTPGGVGPAGRHVHDLRLQARQPARRRPHLRRPLPARTRTTSRSCAT